MRADTRVRPYESNLTDMRGCDGFVGENLCVLPHLPLMKRFPKE